MPIAWLQLPVRCAILRGTDRLELTIQSDKNPSSSAPASPPKPAFPAAFLPIGGPGSPASASASASASVASAASAASASAPAAASASAATSTTAASAGAASPRNGDGHGNGKGKNDGAGAGADADPAGGKRLKALLAAQDIVRVGANDEDNERAVAALEVEPGSGGQRGAATLAGLWAGENQRKVRLGMWVGCGTC